MKQVLRKTNIEIGNQTIITCENHGLEKGDYIYIEDSDSKPTINNNYIITEIIDKNKLTIETNIQNKNERKEPIHKMQFKHT